MCNVTEAALIHLTRQLAGELGPTCVVGIAPGLVQTDFTTVAAPEWSHRSTSETALRHELAARRPAAERD
jgi:NAD(P)-dependent dehydrogenase (short-subunit alcohol dehydrogenase family)